MVFATGYRTKQTQGSDTKLSLEIISMCLDEIDVLACRFHCRIPFACKYTKNPETPKESQEFCLFMSIYLCFTSYSARRPLSLTGSLINQIFSWLALLAAKGRRVPSVIKSTGRLSLCSKSTIIPMCKDKQYLQNYQRIAE